MCQEAKDTRNQHACQAIRCFHNTRTHLLCCVHLASSVALSLRLLLAWLLLMLGLLLLLQQLLILIGLWPRRAGA